MKEKLTLADLGRVFDALKTESSAGDVPGESYEQALARAVHDHGRKQARAIEGPLGNPSRPPEQIAYRR